MRETFNCQKSTVISGPTNDVVSVSFDSPTTRAIMETIIRANRHAPVVMKVSPIHDPKLLIIESIGKKKGKPNSGSGMGFGFVVDEAGKEGLMPVSAYTPTALSDRDGQDDAADRLSQTAPATETNVIIEGGAEGEILMTLELHFPKPQMQG